MSQGMFSGLTRFIDQMDDTVGDLVQQQVHKEREKAAADAVAAAAHQQQQSAHQRKSSSSSSGGGAVHDDTAATTSLPLPPPPPSGGSLHPMTSSSSSTSSSMDPHHDREGATTTSSQQQGSRYPSTTTAAATAPLSATNSNNINSDRNIMIDQADPIGAPFLHHLQHDFDVAVAQLKSANAENQLLHRQLEQLRGDSEDAKARVSELQGKLNVLSESSRAEVSAKDAAEETLRDLQNQVESLHRDNQLAANRARLAEEALAASRRDSAQAKEAAESRVAELEAVASAFEEKKSAASDDVAVLEQRVASLKQSLEDRTRERDELLASSTTGSSRGEAPQGGDSAAAVAAVEELKLSVKDTKELYEGEQAAHRATRVRLEALLEEKEEEVTILERQLHRGASAGTAGGGGGNSRFVAPTPLRTDTAAGGTTTSAAAAAATSHPSSNDGSNGDAEWERRAKDLADLVMEKQRALELKGNEANQWRSRYETAQQRLREAELMAAVSNAGGGGAQSAMHQRGAAGGGGSNGGHRAITIDGASEDQQTEDLAKNPLVQMLTKRGGRGVATAVQYLRTGDTWLQRLIGALRRNPILRLALAFYVGLVHLWVLVLLWTAPIPTATTTP